MESSIIEAFDDWEMIAEAADKFPFEIEDLTRGSRDAGK